MLYDLTKYVLGNIHNDEWAASSGPITMRLRLLINDFAKTARQSSNELPSHGSEVRTLQPTTPSIRLPLPPIGLSRTICPQWRSNRGPRSLWYAQYTHTAAFPGYCAPPSPCPSLSTNKSTADGPARRNTRSSLKVFGQRSRTSSPSMPAGPRVFP